MKETYLLILIIAPLALGASLPSLPTDGFRIKISTTPATSAIATFGYGSLDESSWIIGGKLHRHTVSLGIPSDTYTDLCRLYKNSLLVIGSSSIGTCIATDSIWPVPPIFGSAGDSWTIGDKRVSCAESPSGLCDLYTREIDNVLWKTTWTARYQAGTSIPISCVVIGLFSAKTIANVTLWDTTPQVITIPESCNNAIQRIVYGSDSNSSEFIDESEYLDDAVPVNHPPRLPCVSHVKFSIDVGTSGIMYTQEKWITLGASLSTQTISGVPLTNDVTTTRLVRRDLNRTFTTSSATSTCSVKYGYANLDDGSFGTFDVDALTWTKTVVSPCSYDSSNEDCDLYTGTNGVDTLKLWYKKDANQLLAGTGTRKILFITLNTPVSILLWEIGTVEDSSVFDVDTSCGSDNSTVSFPSLEDPPMALLLPCIGYCDQEFPSENDQDNDVDSSTKHKNNDNSENSNNGKTKQSSSLDSKNSLNSAQHFVPFFTMLLVLIFPLVTIF